MSAANEKNQRRESDMAVFVNDYISGCPRPKRPGPIPSRKKIRKCSFCGEIFFAAGDGTPSNACPVCVREAERNTRRVL